MKKQQHKYRLKISKPKKEDYTLGGFSLVPKEVLQKDRDWTAYLPIKEFQDINNIEPYACVAFTVLNCVEILIKRKYGEDVNYSDRFLAAVSGTKEGGNSPQTVCEFLRKVGVVPQELWPFNKSIDSFKKFYTPLPPKLYELAKEFNEKWDFKHEYVDGKDIDDALLYSPLLISVYAWIKEGSLYVKPRGKKDNHATTYVRRTVDSRVVFDSYDADLKDVDLNALPMVAKRFWIKKKEVTSKFTSLIKLWTTLRNIFIRP